MWNVPCGYLDYNETIAECCSREIAEETNLYVNPKDLEFLSYNDDPKENRQNITFRFYTFSDTLYKGQTIYPKGKEENEVEDVEWININDIDNYDWAFNHSELIKSIVLNYLNEFIPFELSLKFYKDLFIND